MVCPRVDNNATLLTLEQTDVITRRRSPQWGLENHACVLCET